MSNSIPAKAVFRRLRMARVYTLSFITILGFCSASIIAYVLAFRPVIAPDRPFANPESLVFVESVDNNASIPSPITVQEFLAFSDGSRMLNSFAGTVGEQVNAVFEGEAEGVSIDMVTSNFFSVLGVHASAGRLFLTSGEGETGTAEAVLGHRYWLNRFGGDKRVVGRHITLADRSYTIVGIAPPMEPLPYTYGNVYVPMRTGLRIMPSGGRVVTLARLAAATTPVQAESELRVISSRMPALHGARRGVNAIVRSAISGASLPQASRVHAITFSGLTVLGLLYGAGSIALASLLSVRLLSQRIDIAIRMALGGSLAQALFPFIIECVILLLCSTAFGTLLCEWIIRIVNAFLQQVDKPPSLMTQLSCIATVNGLTVAMCFPWLAIRKSQLGRSTGGYNPTWSTDTIVRRIRNVITVVQSAFAVVLIALSLSAAAAATALTSQYLGFNVHNKVAVFVAPPPDRRQSGAEYVQRQREVMETLQKIPGVLGTASASMIIPSYYYPSMVKLLPNTVEDPIPASICWVSPTFLQTIGCAMREGQSISELGPARPVVVVNEEFAKRYSPDIVIGKSIQLFGSLKYEVVGVVSNMRSPREESHPTVYVPYGALSGGPYFVLLSLKSSADTSLAMSIRRAIFSIEPQTAVMTIASLESQVRSDISLELLLAAMLSWLSALAAAMLVLGTFAVTAFIVNRRRREYAIRAALGATPVSIRLGIIGGATAWSASGAALGAIVLLTVRYLSAPTLGQRIDPVTFGLEFAMPASVTLAIIGTILPAIWASRMQPSDLLRSE